MPSKVAPVALHWKDYEVSSHTGAIDERETVSNNGNAGVGVSGLTAHLLNTDWTSL